ncbi:MAG: XdhC family protein [Nocardiopsaceae bacterium]|nr:XdhC family protein [Nocardiopsaceae bacterium]
MSGLGVLEQASELARKGETFALATVVWRQGPSSSKQGSRAIITTDGKLTGWIGGACAEPIVIREAKQVIEDHNARLILLGTPDQFGAAVPDGMTVVPISCQSEGALEVYIEPVLPVPHLVVVGSSPMAQTLAGLGRTLGWNTDLVAGPDFTIDHVGPRSMVIVATQGHDDEDITQRAIAAHPAYLGLVASRKRGEAVLGYLADSGVPLPELERVQAPAGLDLGRTSHEEMAVAVLAQLVQMRAAGAFDRQVPPPHPERTELNVVEPLTAVDPVCGMTVDADSSAHPFTHDGVTYYFCCAGCRRSFEKDPDAYLKKEAVH